MSMKRFAYLAAGLLAFSACAEDEEAPLVQPAPQPEPPSVIADYDLGIVVEVHQSVSTTTLKFTQLGATVTQIDNVAPTANTNPTAGTVECVVNDAVGVNNKTIVVNESETHSRTRVAGRQHVWLMFDSYFGNGASGGNGPDDQVNAIGRPDAGHLFISEPELAIYVEVQAAAECNCELENYVEVVEADMYIIEEDSDLDEGSTTVVTMTSGGANTTTTDRTITEVVASGNQNRVLSKSGRYERSGYVWQTNSLSNWYNGAFPFTASMVGPVSAQVGDSWLDESGRLNVAVAEEDLEINGTTIPTLVVVTRGSTEVQVETDGLLGWCIEEYISQNVDNPVTDEAEKGAALTDLCNDPGGPVGLEGLGTGWVNQITTWYYKGLVVKQIEDRVDVDVQEFGFAIPNNDADFFRDPAGLATPPCTGTSYCGGGWIGGGAGNNGAAVGQCALYNNANAISFATPTTIATAVAAANLWKFYAIYTVSNTQIESVATDIIDDFDIADEYADEVSSAAEGTTEATGE